jgi:hypothetical protein
MCRQEKPLQNITLQALNAMSYINFKEKEPPKSTSLLMLLTLLITLMSLLTSRQKNTSVLLV